MTQLVEIKFKRKCCSRGVECVEKETELLLDPFLSLLFGCLLREWMATGVVTGLLYSRGGEGGGGEKKRTGGNRGVGDWGWVRVSMHL